MATTSISPDSISGASARSAVHSEACRVAPPSTRLHLVVAQVRCHRVRHRVPLAGPDHQHHAAYVVAARRRVAHATRPGPGASPSGSSTLLTSAPTRVPAPAARITTAAGMVGGYRQPAARVAVVTAPPGPAAESTLSRRRYTTAIPRNLRCLRFRSRRARPTTPGSRPMTFDDECRTRAAAGGLVSTTTAPPDRRTGRWIDDWRPEDPEFWESTGGPVARRNLVWSIFAEHLGFSVWLLLERQRRDARQGRASTSRSRSCSCWWPSRTWSARCCGCRTRSRCRGSAAATGPSSAHCCCWCRRCSSRSRCRTRPRRTGCSC